MQQSATYSNSQYVPYQAPVQQFQAPIPEPQYVQSPEIPVEQPAYIEPAPIVHKYETANQYELTQPTFVSHQYIKSETVMPGTKPALQPQNVPQASIQEKAEDIIN